ncbi:Uncharacterised protein [uncultured archaeon]|nr:Uncharacterised protein [uncultured archaeon]
MATNQPQQPNTSGSANVSYPKPSRDKSSTPLPLPSNNFASLGYTFVLLDENSNVIQEITLAVPPEGFNQVEHSTSSVILTAGDAFSDSFGPGLTQITLSGTFGQRPTGNSLFGSNQLSPTSSGQYLVLQLRDMFRKYLDRLNPIMTPDSAKNAKTKLQFYNPKDNEFWNIEPTGNWFTLSRSKGSPFLYRYELAFTCLGRAASSSKDIMDPQSFRANVTNTLGSIYDKAATLMTTMSAYAGGITSLLNQMHLSTVLFTTNLTAPMASLQTAVNSYLSNSSNVINYPFSQIEEIKTYLGGVQDSIKISVIDAAANPGQTPGFVYDPYVDNLLNQAVQILDAYALYPNSFVKTFVKSDFVNQTTVYDPALQFINLNTVQSATYYTIKSGDTIEGISLTTLGDSKYWKAIAEFNGLAYPYVTDLVPQPDKTFGPGQSIAIPNTLLATVTGNLILGSSSPSNQSVDSALGTDFALDSNGDIIFENGDIKLVSGIQNMKQAMFLKLNVRRGELVSHSHYGMADLRGYRTSSLLSAKAAAEFHDTILSDARVSDLTNASVSINGDILSYSAEVSVKLTTQPIVVQNSLNTSA